MDGGYSVPALFELVHILVDVIGVGVDQFNEVVAGEDETFVEGLKEGAVCCGHPGAGFGEGGGG